jgi:hypothetical protein
VITLVNPKLGDPRLRYDPRSLAANVAGILQFQEDVLGAKVGRAEQWRSQHHKDFIVWAWLGGAAAAQTCEGTGGDDKWGVRQHWGLNKQRKS